MSKSGKWSKKLQSFGISEFVSIDQSLYDMEKDLISSVGKLSMSSTYY